MINTKNAFTILVYLLCSPGKTIIIPDQKKGEIHRQIGVTFGFFWKFVVGRCIPP